MGLFEDINSKMTGRVALLSEKEAALLEQIAAIPGDHIDLGTLWGGTAILAALAKQQAGVKGKVYTVDFMQGGYWADGDPSAGGQRPSEAAIRGNLEKFGLVDQVTLIKAASDPWPVPASVHPTSVLIDCDHTYEGCFRDWKAVRALRPQFVAFHDFNPVTHPGVTMVVDVIMAGDDLYTLSRQAGTMVVFELKAEPVVAKKAPVLVEEEPVVVQEELVKAPVKAPAKKPAVAKAKLRK